MTKQRRNVAGDVASTARLRDTVHRLRDPFTALGPDLARIVENYVTALAALVQRTDPNRGRAIEAASTSTHPDDRDIDRKPAWAARRLDWELDDLVDATARLIDFAEEPRDIPQATGTRLERCPNCRHATQPRHSYCPRCSYDLTADAGPGPRCWTRSCPDNTPERRRGKRRHLHHARFCDQCGNPLTPTERKPRP